MQGIKDQKYNLQGLIRSVAQTTSGALEGTTRLPAFELGASRIMASIDITVFRVYRLMYRV